MLPNTTECSGTDKYVAEPDPIEALLREICIVNANNASFCARLISIREGSEQDCCRRPGRVPCGPSERSRDQAKRSLSIERRRSVRFSAS